MNDKNLVSYSRKDYMDRKVTHQEYYFQFGKHLIDYVQSIIGKDRIINSTDPHFNDIPLKLWDDMEDSIRMMVGRKIGEANGTGGLSLSDTVCAAKSAAKHIRVSAKGEKHEQKLLDDDLQKIRNYSRD